MRRLLLTLLLALMSTSAYAQNAGQRFAAIAFHDVTDTRGELGTDSVTINHLVAFFDWLKGDGWIVVSLDDVAAAETGRKPLPDKAILLTFDDGYRSLYSRVFPLLQAYRYHAVAALVGSWMDGSVDGTVDYGGETVPRRNFVTWDEARQMQSSGFVEFASHTFDLHKGIDANPQGNLIAAARTWRYDPASRRYETDAAYRARLRGDFQRAQTQLAHQLGHPARALVWPFGRSSGLAAQEALSSGFRFALDLDSGPADAAQPMAIPRYFPTLNPGLGEIAENLRFELPHPETVRAACVSLDAMAALPPTAQDQALGQMIENLRTLGANKVVIEAAAAPEQGAIHSLFFPSNLMPLKVDMLSRAVWQIRSRASAEAYVHLSPQGVAADVGADRMPSLFGELARHVAADGLVMEAPTIAGSQVPELAGDARRARERLDPASYDPGLRAVITAFRSAASIDAQLRLILAQSELQGPPAWADYVMGPVTRDAETTVAEARRLREQGWLRPDLAGRSILSLPGDARGEVDALKRAQQLGATGFALCPNAMLPPSHDIAASFSAATYAHRP